MFYLQYTCHAQHVMDDCKGHRYPQHMRSPAVSNCALQPEMFKLGKIALVLVLLVGTRYCHDNLLLLYQSMLHTHYILNMFNTFQK